MSETGTRRAGVAGWPVGQSLSPVMHGFWIAEHRLNAEYSALAIRPEDFPEEVKALAAKGYAGINVTIPHKEAAFRLSTALDDDARATGAVNLLIFSDREILGRNTDTVGFAAALDAALGEGAARNGPCVVLGAGGAARAVIVALARSGAKEIRILNRTHARAVSTIDAVKTAESNIIARLNIFEWGDWNGAFSGAGLLVNTTSLGMTGKAALDIPLDALPLSAGVGDIVYNPLQTELLRAAKARGHRTMDGLGMLMHQAVPAFEAWFGIRPKVTGELRKVLEEKLNG